MALTPLSLLFLSATILSLLSPQAQAQTPAAPAPSPPGPMNITAILEKGGNYQKFILFLTQTTHVADQINSQVNSSRDGMTVFAPTDNAFNNLPPGTVNNLTTNQQVQLCQYHVLFKAYTLQDLTTVSNPVRTQASGPDGQVYVLNFTGQGNQVNVSTGIVETRVDDRFNQQNEVGHLEVYSLDQVLLPPQFYESPAPVAAPPAANTTTTTGGSSGEKTKPADPPSNGSGQINVGLGLIAGFGLFCMGLLM